MLGMRLLRSRHVIRIIYGIGIIIARYGIDMGSFLITILIFCDWIAEKMFRTAVHIGLEHWGALAYTLTETKRMSGSESVRVQDA